MKKIYALDIRSLTLFRAILAIFIASEFLFYVLGNFAEIYSPETGVLGNAYGKEYLDFYKINIGIFFIHSDFGMLLFITLIVLSMLLLAIGIYPQIIAAIGCFLLYLFFNRYSVLYFGWEMYATVLLFWLIFIPSNNLFHYNKPIKESSSTTFEWRSPVAFVFLFQIGFIYFYNGLSKNGDVWMTGQAVESFLSESDKLTSFGVWFKSLETHNLNTTLSYSVLFIELIIMLFLFIPYRSVFFRYTTLISIFTFHWGIALLADVGHFKYLAIAVSVALLPAHFWDKIVALIPSLNKQKTTKTKTTESIDNQLITFAILKNPLTQKTIAFTLFCSIVFSNLSQTAASGTSDRMKNIIQATGFQSVLSKINYRMLPQYSFFTQYWHLYAPNPPREKGYMQVEVVTVDNDSIPVFNGKPLNDKMYESNLQRYFFSMLMNKKGRNEKEKIAEKQLMLNEIRLWNKAPKKPKLKALQIIHYSRHFDAKTGIEPDFKRIKYKIIDIKYK